MTCVKEESIRWPKDPGPSVVGRFNGAAFLEGVPLQGASLSGQKLPDCGRMVIIFAAEEVARACRLYRSMSTRTR
jgi:hypothetical protein